MIDDLRLRRKILIIMLSILLCSCGRNEIQISNSDAGFRSYDENVVKNYILSRYDGSSEYEIGNGVLLIDEKAEETDIYVFPVYQDDHLIFLVIKRKGELLFEDDNQICEKIEKGNNYVLMSCYDHLCFVSEEEFIMFEKDLNLSKKQEKEITEMEKRVMEDNPLGKKREKITVIEQSETDTRKDRIIVRFTEGDHEQKIRDFEEFCDGKLLMKYKSSDIYVFTFDPLNEKALKKLLNDSNALDYVVSASLDQQNDINESSASMD